MILLDAAADATGWTPSDVATLAVSIFAATLAALALVMQLLLWRREGPLIRVEILPATVVTPGEVMVGVHPEDVDMGGQPAISATVYSTGRQPVYLTQLR